MEILVPKALWEWYTSSCIIYTSDQQLPFRVPVSKYISMWSTRDFQGPDLPLFFADPELMKDAQTSKNTSTKPTTIAALNGVARGMDFSLEYNVKGQWGLVLSDTYMGKGSYELSWQAISKPSKKTSTTS